MKKILIPDKLQFLFKPKRLKIAYGGRGGAKTVSYCKALLFKALQTKLRVLCLREFMNSIEDSVHSALKEEIGELGMSGYYNATKNQITNSVGSLFRYASLSRNLSSIKSWHNVDIAWIEEAETITQKSLDVLIPTIRKNGSEVWISFNPDDEFGAIYHTLVKPHLNALNSQGFHEDENTYICKINLSDNPFAPETMLMESAKMKSQNLKKWMHIYGGDVFSDYRESIIQPEWVDTAIDAHLKLKFPAQGVKVTSFDPADTGKDAKALMLRHGSVITQGCQWKYGELPEAVDKAFDFAYEWRAEELIYDAVGVGTGVKVWLSKQTPGKNIKVTGFRGGDAVDFPDDIYADGKTNKETFKNKRAQYFWYLRDRFEATYHAVTKNMWTDPDKLISISSKVEDLDVLKSELVKIRRKSGPNSYIQIESKEDMKRRGVDSPNMTDALKMCFATSPPTAEIIDIDFDSEF